MSLSKNHKKLVKTILLKRCKKNKKYMCLRYAACYLLLVVSGCSLFEENRVVITPTKIDTVSYEFRRTLSLIIISRYDTGDKTLNDVMADLALAEYNLEIKK